MPSAPTSASSKSIWGDEDELAADPSRRPFGPPQGEVNFWDLVLRSGGSERPEGWPCRSRLALVADFGAAATVLSRLHADGAGGLMFTVVGLAFVPNAVLLAGSLPMAAADSS